MIIYFCTNTYESSGNGPAKFAKILKELNSFEGIELRIFTEDINDFSQDDLIHKVVIRTHFPFSLFGMFSRAKDYNDALQKAISIKKPDVIVFNNAIVGLETYKSEIPTIGMINDNNAIDSSIKNNNFSYDFLRLKLFKYLEAKACINSDGIIVNSDFLLNSVLKVYPIQRNKLYKLYKSFDKVGARNSVSLKNKKEIDILFVKSDFIRGGILDLIEACNLIDKEITIHIVGPLQQHFDYIKSFNKKLNTNLKFYGQLDQNSVYSKLLLVDIFCTPSRQEALGVANMEAMAHYVPVVYTDTGGVSEVMNYGENGFKADPNNPLSIKEAILNCINSDQDREIKLANAYKFVTENFSKKNMLHNFISICKSVVNNINSLSKVCN